MLAIPLDVGFWGIGHSIAMLLRVFASELDLDIFRQADRIFNIDAEVANSAFKLAVSQQQLAGAEVSGLLVNQATLVRRKLWVP